MKHFKSQNFSQINDDYEKYELLGNMDKYFKEKMFKHCPSDYLNIFSLIRKDDPDRKKFSYIFRQMRQTQNNNPQLLQLKSIQEQRGIASMLGLCICDALGATTEFIKFDKSRNIIKNGFKDIQTLVKEKKINQRSGRIGIWTDDASMALAMAYSILYNDYEFKPIHMRYMFILWLEHGLGNGGRKHSIGLGGNISISIGQFVQKQTQYAQTGTGFNNGNGSLMRLAPVPLAFSHNLEKAIEYSQKQSLTTHNGTEAKQCSRLLACIIVNLINRGENQDYKTVLEKTCKEFKTQNQSIKCLANSQHQSQKLFTSLSLEFGSSFKNFNKSPADRNWNWKDKNFTYSKHRYQQQPGYIGSYCMDALSMALHTVWHTKSFKECAILNANYGGDCDTVGAIAGQICGAIYGIESGMLELYSQMEDYKKERYQSFLVSYKLALKKKLQLWNQNKELILNDSEITENSSINSSLKTQKQSQNHFEQNIQESSKMEIQQHK